MTQVSAPLKFPKLAKEPSFKRSIFSQSQKLPKKYTPETRKSIFAHQESQKSSFSKFSFCKTTILKQKSAMEGREPFGQMKVPERRTDHGKTWNEVFSQS